MKKLPLIILAILTILLAYLSYHYKSERDSLQEKIQPYQYDAKSFLDGMAFTERAFQQLNRVAGDTAQFNEILARYRAVADSLRKEINVPENTETDQEETN